MKEEIIKKIKDAIEGHLYELGWDEWGSRQELVIIDGVCITQLDI